jgi:hypothetical protein
MDRNVGRSSIAVQYADIVHSAITEVTFVRFQTEVAQRVSSARKTPRHPSQFFCPSTSAHAMHVCHQRCSSSFCICGRALSRGLRGDETRERLASDGPWAGPTARSTERIASRRPELRPASAQLYCTYRSNVHSVSMSLLLEMRPTASGLHK